MSLHVMIDVEAIGKGPRARLFEFAAVAFDVGGPWDGAIKEEFQTLIDPDQQPWGTADWDTIRWWMRQHEDVRMKYARIDEWPDPAAAALDISVWLTAIKPAGLWAHGLAYDVPIVQSLFEGLGVIKPPWDYAKCRDTRTLFWIAEAMGWNRDEVPQESGLHEALIDCRNQARWVHSAVGYIAARGVGH